MAVWLLFVFNLHIVPSQKCLNSYSVYGPIGGFLKAVFSFVAEIGFLTDGKPGSWVDRVPRTPAGQILVAQVLLVLSTSEAEQCPSWTFEVSRAWLRS